MNRDLPPLTLEDALREDEIGFMQAVICTLHRYKAPEAEQQAAKEKFHALIAARTPAQITVMEITGGLV